MIRPLRNYCLVELIGEEKTTPDGFIVPDALKSKQAKGKILALGKAPYLGVESDFEREIEVKVGQVVQFRRFGGETVIGSEKQMLVPYEQLMGVE